MRGEVGTACHRSVVDFDAVRDRGGAQVGNSDAVRDGGGGMTTLPQIGQFVGPLWRRVQVDFDFERDGG